MYDQGHGLPQDYTQAAIWYRKAAEQGGAEAQFNLGLLFDNGHGVPKDYAEAYFWLDLAASGKTESETRLNGEDVKHEDIENIRDKAASYLTPANLSREQERARKWFEDHPVQANQQ